jgi:hypothetical protein
MTDGDEVTPPPDVPLKPVLPPDAAPRPVLPPHAAARLARRVTPSDGDEVTPPPQIPLGPALPPNATPPPVRRRPTPSIMAQRVPVPHSEAAASAAMLVPTTPAPTTPAPATPAPATPAPAGTPPPRVVAASADSLRVTPVAITPGPLLSLSMPPASRPLGTTPQPARPPLTTPLPAKPISGRHNLPQHLTMSPRVPARRSPKMIRGVTLSKSALAGIWLMAFALGMVTTVLVERWRPHEWNDPMAAEPVRTIFVPAPAPTPAPGVEIVTLPPPEPDTATAAKAPSPPSPPPK